jgi:GAF domain
MSSHETQSRNHLTIHLPVKWVAFFVLGISLIVGAASIATRYEQLQYSATTYYHPYLANAGLSDRFYIWYFLLMDSLLALTFAVTGGIIALRGSATWMTILAAIALMLFGVSVPPPLHALVVQQGELELPLRLFRAIGLALFIIFFYVFPDGRFALRWTQISAIVLVVWSLLYPFAPRFDPYQLPHPFPFVVLSGWLATAVVAQLYRQVKLTEPDQQQQTKWVVFGLTIAVLGDLITHIAWSVFPSLQPGPDWLILFLHHPFFILSQLLVPLSIGFSILRFGLWEIDFIISQTLIYGLLTTFLAAGWATIAKLLEGLFAEVLGPRALPLATGFAVLVVGLTFGATRKYLETFVNNYFYPNKVNLSRDFVEILPEARATISSEELLEILVDRILELFNITHGAIFLCNDDGQSQFVSVGDVEPEAVELFACDAPLLNQVRQGSVVRRPDDLVFPLLVPLMLRQTKEQKTIGVLALGPMRKGRQYSLSELWTFKRFASQAGTAIYIAQINTENYQKLEQKITLLEQQLDSFKASFHQMNPIP